MLDTFCDSCTDFGIRLIIVKGIEVKGQFAVARRTVLPIHMTQPFAVTAFFESINNFRRRRFVVSGQRPRS